MLGLRGGHKRKKSRPTWGDKIRGGELQRYNKLIFYNRRKAASIDVRAA